MTLSGSLALAPGMHARGIREKYVKKRRGSGFSYIVGAALQLWPCSYEA
jgi:hypothetical protein